MVRRIHLISDELTEQLNTVSKKFAWFSLALDKSTDNQDTVQLRIFVRGIDENFVITEKLLVLESMKNTTTGQDLFECAVDCVEKSAVSWNRMASITTDGARVFTGKNVGMIKLLENKLKAEHPDGDILPFHYILRQKSFCKPALDLKHVVNPVMSMVNTIRIRAFYHLQFKSHLEDMEAQYGDVIYHNSKVPASVSSKIRDHWLSLEDEVTRRFQDFKKIEPDLNLLSYPLTADIDTAPEEVQLELIDMQ
ncbi:general transcription factor II-I repeat domain-containing protein 2-like [Octopus bimaculoides]|uniref:general transcription factor II-I repeat domain-containing protein 2-like n=1 Tax=Octopus bimaculoides TaxID=37653 RepID=UPI0022E8D2A4|nr:general transcription factor II-I repeat domain-containing protein 2-like [Octopus bimaculoides]